MLALKLHSPMYFLSHRIYSRWCFWQVSKHYINSNSRAIHKACQKQEQTLEKWIFGIILGVLFWTYICLSSFWQQIKLLQFCAYLQLLDADFFNRHCFWNCCTWFTSAVSKIKPAKAYFWISKLMLSTERMETVLYLELEIDTKVKTILSFSSIPGLHLSIHSFNYNGQLVNGWTNGKLVLRKAGNLEWSQL